MRTVGNRVSREAIAKNGGSEIDIEGKPGFRIPAAPLQALPLEQWPYGTNGEDVPIQEYDFK